jgi:hypothetical protein
MYMVIKIIIKKINKNIDGSLDSNYINDIFDNSEFYRKDTIKFINLYEILKNIINFILYYKIIISLFIIIILCLICKNT